MFLLEKLTFGGLQKKIASLREKKGKEKEALSLINRTLRFGQGVVVNLFWEKALIYQHIVMAEDSNLEPNPRKRNEALVKMEAAVLAAGKYIKQNSLKEWESRYYRFLGRVYDYKGKFSDSVKMYKKAVPLAKLDPDYTQKGFPRWLEIEGFLSYCLIMSGKVKEGYDLARKVDRKFDKSEEGLALKKKDYYTWAIWKSGILIRTIGALNLKKYLVNRDEALSWLSDAEKVLTPPAGVKIWGSFELRKDEIAVIRKQLSLN